jgi:hypothetical protein
MEVLLCLVAVLLFMGYLAYLSSRDSRASIPKAPRKRCLTVQLGFQAAECGESADCNAGKSARVLQLCLN